MQATNIAPAQIASIARSIDAKTPRRTQVRARERCDLTDPATGVGNAFTQRPTQERFCFMSVDGSMFATVMVATEEG
ncbi:MAG TPA: hypothetical protein VEP70_08845 [Burkholderiales bacterium]|jgi:hypothetical protein|nr:hypothetical protein [Burkholderiales bacterium]